MLNLRDKSQCPKGYRFVVQLVDEPTEAAAVERFARMFGADKAAKVKAVPGILASADRNGAFRRPGWYESGFRMYLPVSEPTFARDA